MIPDAGDVEWRGRVPAGVLDGLRVSGAVTAPARASLVRP